MVLSVVFLLAGGVHLRLEWPLLVRERPQCHYQPSKHPKASPIFGLHHKDTRLCFETKFSVFMILFVTLWGFFKIFFLNISVEFSNRLVQWFNEIDLILRFWICQFSNLNFAFTVVPLFFNSERIPWSFKPWTSSTESYCMSINTEIVHLSMKENQTKLIKGSNLSNMKNFFELKSSI